mmetsp:Transcript_42402/g.76982  ORF Transcript_42402/g.76982 Transcript_42402/m.76982 type:complete len:82 (-) Transcript_42402:794-1039(-)
MQRDPKDPGHRLTAGRFLGLGVSAARGRFKGLPPCAEGTIAVVRPATVWKITCLPSAMTTEGTFFGALGSPPSLLLGLSHR